MNLEKRLVNKRLVVPALDVEILPISSQAYIKDLSERMNVNPEMVAIPLLITLAGVLGRTIAVTPKALDKSWIEHPNLFGAVIAPPSSKKSPVLSQVMKFTERHEREYNKQYEKQMISFYKNTDPGILKRLTNNNIDINSRNFLKSDAQHPIHKRLTCNDITVEKLAEILKDNPEGLLFYRDELAGLFEAFKIKGQNQLRPFLLEAWKGTGSFKVDRIGRGTQIIDHCCISILGTIQPEIFKNHFNIDRPQAQQNDGLLARFQLLIHPDKPLAVTSIDRKPCVSATKQIEWIFSNAFKIRQNYTKTKNHSTLSFDKSSQFIFNDFLFSLEEELHYSSNISDFYSEFLGKYRSLVPKLAMIFHVIEGNRTELISESSIKKSIELSKYLRLHLEKIFGLQLKNEEFYAFHIQEKILSGNLSAEFGLRDIYRKQWSHLRDRHKVHMGLNYLVEHEFLKFEGGRYTFNSKKD